MTTAEELAKQLGNDGQTWETAEGIENVENHINLQGGIL